ncbi:cytidine deaminase [Pseudoalteromonas sp. MMG010]|uniref:cytidine deaminase n=1 Tax=Pseudoalteromonas sp. MMG010 TaxID=2822685 RepID=UPI001B3A375B|nr:cytidine deaminase [Pseudoalteromonas sp. MMG010]MBQ4833726.1 cytidine deaminase [Pseudoalteromonas sp. MMG010]
MASTTFSSQQSTALQNKHISLSLEQTHAIRSQIKNARGILRAEDIDQWCNTLSVSKETLLQGLVPFASEFAVAPISKFYVGAIVSGLDENELTHFYFGANVEFDHQALSLVVHAEQSAINNAWLNGAKKITQIAISDAPCGYCRQFMNELADANEFDILLPKQAFKLNELLPHSFGPSDLGNKYSLFNSAPQQYQFVDETLDKKLVEYALKAYVPYTNNYSAVKISTAEQGDFYGSYAENAAYSPSLSPLQSAISQFFLAGLNFDGETVTQITLLETKGFENQRTVTTAALASFGSIAKLQVISAPIVAINS